MPRRPNLFIIGAPKSGTTSLHRYLQEHPQVFMSRLKEPGYFAPDVTGTRPVQRFKHPRDEQRYLELFAAAGDQLRVGESSTNYLLSRRAPGLVRAFAPDALIIAMVRNPVDLVYALHDERRANGSEPLADFREAVAEDEHRRRGERLPPNLRGYGVAYRDNALLGQQVERWLDEFGSDRMRVIVFDDFVADTASEYARLLSFIGVEPTQLPTSFAIHNPSHRRRQGPVGAIIRSPLVRWLSRRAAPSLIGERRASELGRRTGLRQTARYEKVRKPLDESIRAQMAEEFLPEVERLGQLLGRRLDDLWFKPESATETTADPPDA